jgi:colanic acid/amylovoran biosynthesis glycosyltransferase
MKPRKLLMVTSGFPYGQGEAFVKADLHHVARHFDEVEIVPCFYTAQAVPRSVPQRVNLAYAAKRWGALRIAHLLMAFAGALWHYRWRDDARFVITNNHRVQNGIEFVRALYRARLFEDFLVREFIDKKRAFDLVYFYWMVPEIMGAIHFRARFGQLPLKIVTRAHGGDLYEDRRSGGYCGLRGSIALGIDEIYCISDHGRAYLAERYPFTHAKLHTARLGVDDPGFLNVQPDGGALSVASCSFVVPGKRLHLVVDAIAHLLAAHPALTLRWTHIGDGELFASLRARVAQRLGERAHVVFKGYLQPEQIREVYRHEPFDVFVNVSDCEGVPVSLMEASAVGIPMVATNVGGSGEIVNADNGLLIAADADVATIAAALMGFHDRPRAVAFRVQARRALERGFNAQTNYDGFGRELLGLLERAPAPP